MQNCKMPELQGSRCNSRNGNGWKWLKMLHQIKISPPIDLRSERLILTLKISPSNNHCNPSLQIPLENNIVTEGYCIVGARKSVGKVLRSAICSKGFPTDLSNEREPPPLKNKPMNGVVDPHCNTLQNNIILLQK